MSSVARRNLTRQVVFWVLASATRRRHSCAGAAGAAVAVLRLPVAGWRVSGFPLLWLPRLTVAGWRVSGFPLASRMAGVWLPRCLASPAGAAVAVLRLTVAGWRVSGFPDGGCLASPGFPVSGFPNDLARARRPVGGTPAAALCRSCGARTLFLVFRRGSSPREVRRGRRSSLTPISRVGVSASALPRHYDARLLESAVSVGQPSFASRNLVRGAWLGAFVLIVCARVLPALVSFAEHHQLERANRRLLFRMLYEAEGAKLATESRASNSRDQELGWASQAEGAGSWTARDTANLERAIESRRELVEYHSALKWKALRAGVLFWEWPPEEPPPPSVPRYRRYYECVRFADDYYTPRY